MPRLYCNAHRPRRVWVEGFSLIIAVAALFFSATAQAELRVSEGWVRAAPPVATMLAGYGVLENAGDTALQITNLTSPLAGHLMLHATETLDDGTKRMRHVGVLDLAPGEQVALAPGGMHLMFMRVAHVPAVGESVPVCFTVSTMLENETTEIERCLPLTVKRD